MTDHPHLIDDIFAVGPYGEAALITAAAAGWYSTHGTPEHLARSGDIHPYLDYLACQHTHHADNPWRQPDAVTHPPDGTPTRHDPDGPHSWTADDHPCDQALTGELTARLTEDGLDLDPYQPDLVGVLATADTDLHTALPHLWPQTRPFVLRARLVADHALTGMSWPDLTGLVLLGRATTHDRRLAAEALLHEALHAKAARTSRAFTVPFSPTTPEFIEIPWWRGPHQQRLWDTRRVFDAHYIYSHLTAYHACRHALGHTDTVPLHRAAFRAAYLLNILRQLDQPWLDPQRRTLTEWLAARTPSPAGLTAIGERFLQCKLSSFPYAETALDATGLSAR